MADNSSKRIESLSDFMDEIKQIHHLANKSKTGIKKDDLIEFNLYYRGQSNINWNIASGCLKPELQLQNELVETFNKIREELETIERSNDSSENKVEQKANIIKKYEQFLNQKKDAILKHQKKIIEKSQKYFSYDKPEYQEVDNIDLLTQIQHYGGNTLLIDFTTNPLIALFFACNQKHFHPETNEEIDGVVVCLKNDEELKVEELSTSDKRECGGKLETLFAKLCEKKQTLNPYTWSKIWQPSILNHRILKQSSVFYINTFGVINKESFYKYLVIDARSKSIILDELKQVCDISEENIYPDFQGFVANNSKKFKI